MHAAPSISLDADERGLTDERGPIRTCVGCRMRAPKDELVRLVPAPAGFDGPSILVDVSGRLPGRGLSIHPQRGCVEAAVKKGGIAQVLRRAPGLTPDALAEAMASRLSARALSILVAARGARALAVGTEAVREALAEGRLVLIVFAEDAEGRREELTNVASRLGLGTMVIRTGDVRTKAALGKMFGRDELAVVGVLDHGIAERVTQALTAALGLLGVGQLAPAKAEAR